MPPKRYYDGVNVVAKYAKSTSGGEPGDLVRCYEHRTNGIDRGVPSPRPLKARR